MKKISLGVLSILCTCALGCSIPMTAKYSQLDIFPPGKADKKSKFSIFMPARKPENFLGDKVSKADIEAVKEKSEKYILAHNDLDDASKQYLRDLKVVRGATMEEVRLMLGEPLKIVKSGKNARPFQETWVYKTKKADSFRVLVIPLFSVNETYYLYFKDNILTGINKRYLQQATGSNSRPGQ
jgi:hypothetical protein